MLKSLAQIVVSVVVPLYNSEKYIEEAIDSILNQSFKNLEIIIVDDGSTDNSLQICKNKYGDNPFVRIISTENRGVVKARMTGVQNAIGAWIAFVDSDDYLMPNALELLYNGININGFKVDMVVPGDFDNLINGDDYRKKVLLGNQITNSVCAKLYRKSLLDNFTFDIPSTIQVGEDLLMNIRAARLGKELNVKVLNINPAEIYFYRKNINSITNRFKRTENYEETFYCCLEKSFSAKEIDRFRNEIITSKLTGLKWVSRAQNFKINRESQFYQDLVKDIKKTKYSLTFEQKCLINSNIHFMLVFYLKKVVFGLRKRLF